MFLYGSSPNFFSLWLRVTVTLCPELAEVLDAGGKGVALDAGTKLAREADEFEVEALAGDVGIGVHVEAQGGGQGGGVCLQGLFVVAGEEGGRGDGNGFPAGGEHGDAVGDAFGNPEVFAGTETGEDGEVVDAATAATGEAEAGDVSRGTEVAALDTEEMAVDVAVGYEQGGGIEVGTAITPAGRGLTDAADAQPTDYSGAEPALGKEEVTGGLVELGVLDQVAEPFHIGTGNGLELGGSGPCFGRKDVVLVGQPLAGFEEGFVEHLHGEVDDASVGFAHKAVVGVGPGIEGEAGVAVVVKGTEGLVLLYREAQAMGGRFDGDVSDGL